MKIGIFGDYAKINVCDDPPVVLSVSRRQADVKEKQFLVPHNLAWLEKHANFP
jgi:hypothetical protein